MRAVENLKGKVGRISASILNVGAKLMGNFRERFRKFRTPVRFFHDSSAEPGISGSLMLKRVKRVAGQDHEKKEVHSFFAPVSTPA